MISKLVFSFCVFLFFCCGFFRSAAQPSDKLKSALIEQGFENVRVIQQDSSFIITLENPVYRWDVAAIARALDMIAGTLPDPSELKLILLEKEIPRVVVTIHTNDWQQFRKGELTAADMEPLLLVSEDTGEEWHRVRSEKNGSPSTGKTDLVLYPQFSFENTLGTQLYEVQLNIAPALQLSLWRGMLFTGQLIFPLYNERGYEGDFIRPGQIMLSQEFKHHRLTGMIAAGNFSSSRYGGDLSFRYLLPNENWSLKLNAGLTGSFHFFDKQWKFGSLHSFTGSLSATWFISRFNMETEGGIRRYIYGDTGIFGSCTRWFGETAVGFYAMVSDVSVNGGFHFSISFPDKKRNRKHFFRVTIPDHQDMVYNAGTEFYYGQSYRVGPGTNMVRGFYRAAYMKREILRLRD